MTLRALPLFSIALTLATPALGQGVESCPRPSTSVAVTAFHVPTRLSVVGAWEAVHAGFDAQGMATVPDTSTTVVRWWQDPLPGQTLPPGGLTATLTPVAGGTRITVQAVRVTGTRLEAISHTASGWQGRLWCQARSLATRLERLPALTLSQAIRPTPRPLLDAVPQRKPDVMPLPIAMQLSQAMAAQETSASVRSPAERPMDLQPMTTEWPEPVPLPRDTTITRGEPAPTGWAVTGGRLEPIVATPTAPAQPPRALRAQRWHVIGLVGAGPVFGIELQRPGTRRGVAISAGIQRSRFLGRSKLVSAPLADVKLLAGSRYLGDIFHGSFLAGQLLLRAGDAVTVGLGGGVALHQQDGLVEVANPIDPARPLFRVPLRTTTRPFPRASVSTNISGVIAQLGVLGYPSVIQLGVGIEW